MYRVESIGTNRVIRVHRRADDYDDANESFTSLRSYPCRELRMVRITKGISVLLKFLTKQRHDPKRTPR